MPRTDPVHGHVRRRDYVQLSYGLHIPRELAEDEAARLEAWALVLPPTGCFTGVTAAGAYGWPLPALPPDAPVFAAVHKEEGRPRRAGLRVVRQSAPPARRRHRGLPLATPEEALLVAARDFGLVDLCLMVDAACRGRFATPEGLRAACAGRTGGPMLARTLEFADARAESAWETILRLFHVACEIPVEPQYEVRGPDGELIARGDLRIAGTRVLHEYDGAVHRDRQQHQVDLARERGLGNIRWTRRGYTARTILRQPLQILREADDALGREHDPGRLEGWYALLKDSTLSPSGMARLRRRWKLPPEVRRTA